MAQKHLCTSILMVKAVSFSDRQVDLSAYKGEIDLKATTDNGGVTKLKVIR